MAVDVKLTYFLIYYSQLVKVIKDNNKNTQSATVHEKTVVFPRTYQAPGI